MADILSDTVKEIYEVIYGPRVPCRKYPDSKSVKVTTKEKGETVITDAWDGTRNWRRVWVENDAGEIQAAWMQVMSESLGQMLLAMGPVDDKADHSRDAHDAIQKASKRIGGFSRLAADNVRSDERCVPSHNVFVQLPAEFTLPPKSSSYQLYSVVFEPYIAVRAYPSMTAPAIRALKFGTLIRLFEWDKHRRWRRVTLPTQVDDFSDTRGCCKMEDIDGWVLVVHPMKGMLVEAALEEEEEGPVIPASTEDHCIENNRTPNGGTVQSPEIQGYDAARCSAEESHQTESARTPAELAAGQEPLLDAFSSQLYRVVFKPRIPVRTSPSSSSLPMRALQYGAVCRCFEWDPTLRWRRVTIPRQLEDGSDPQKSCSQDSDGWVLVRHPSHGVLLEEVAEGASSCDIGNAPKEDSVSPPREVSKVVELALAALQESPQNCMLKVAAPTQFHSNNELHVDLLLESVERNPDEPLLIQATRTGHLQVVESILRSFANPNTVNEDGETALFAAAANAHTDIVARLLLCKVQVDGANHEGMTALSVTTDVSTRNLMKKFKGDRYNDASFARAFRKLAPTDQKRVMQLFKISEPPDEETSDVEDHEETAQGQEEIVQITNSLENRFRHVVLTAENGEGGDEKDEEGGGGDEERLPLQTSEADALATCSHESQESGALFLDSCRDAENQLRDAIVTFPECAVDAAQIPPCNAEIPLPSEARLLAKTFLPSRIEEEDEEELELDERGVPKRTEISTPYRVVHKMVAVRRFPDTKSSQIRAKKMGDIVAMFEWDHTKLWRRVETFIMDEECEDGKLIPSDGWMLTHSEKLGTLLERISRAELEATGEQEDEEMAG